MKTEIIDSSTNVKLVKWRLLIFKFYTSIIFSNNQIVIYPLNRIKIEQNRSNPVKRWRNYIILVVRFDKNGGMEEAIKITV